MSRTRKKSLQEFMHDQQVAAQQLYELAATATTPSTKTTMAGPGGADGNFHISNQGAYLKTIAFARMMENNDAAVMSAANRLVDLCNVGQMTPQPDTGDDDLNEHLQGKWQEHCEDADLCDDTGRMTYEMQADLAFRRIMVDGDIFAVPNADTGAVLHLEGHRCQAPTYGKRNRGVCGVESRNNRPHRYWLTRQNTGYGQVVRVKDLKETPARTPDGWANVFHCYRPRMFTLNRGVSVLGACGAMNSMRDDLQFATLLKAQVASCVTFVETMEDAEVFKLFLENNGVPGVNEDVGEVHFSKDAAGYELATADMHPGRVLRTKPGYKLSMEAPNLPGEGQLELNLLLLQYLAMCWDLPLMVLLLDARMANLSTYRGIMDLARLSFTKHQRWFGACYHGPRYRNWLRLLAKTDSMVKSFRASEGKAVGGLRQSRIMRHTWTAPAPKYYDPVKDATGDLIQLANSMMSYDQYARRRHAKTGAQLRDEIIAFHLETYRKILAAKVQLLSEFSGKLPELQINEHLFFPWPAMTGIHMSMSDENLAMAGAGAGGDS